MKKMFDIENHRTSNIPRLLEKMGAAEDVTCTEGAVKTASIILTFRIYHPVALKLETRVALPTLLYVPGTGFNTLMLPGWSGIICSHFARKSGYQIIALNHRLAPEHPFPAAVQDIELLVRHIVKYAERYKVDINNILLGGYSSGGNIAAVVSELLAKDRISIKALYLISPMLDLSRSITTYKEYEKYDHFPEDLVQWMIGAYVGSADRKHSAVSPFWSETPQCLPNIIRLFVAEYDRFRGDTELFAEKIKASTNKWVTKYVFQGEIHAGFWYNIRNVEAVIKFLRLDDMQIPRSNMAFQCTV